MSYHEIQNPTLLACTLRHSKKNTSLKFVVTYSDPAAGHLGTIYQATNWLYTGLSSATPLYDIGDGILHHSRSLAHGLGTHSIRYLASQGISVKTVPQSAKHRYIYFLDQVLAIPPDGAGITLSEKGE